MFKHILVPLDGSAFAEAALPYAQSLAGKYQAEITLLRVIVPPRWPGVLEAELPELIERLSKTAAQDATSYLQYRQESLQAQGLRVTARAQSGEPAPDLILEIAKELNCDLIVMSTHGRSGLQRWMFGSVAERVLRHAEIPVMLIRPKE